MSNRRALFHLRTLPTTVLALAAVGVSGSALAQSTANGEMLYKKAVTINGVQLACQDCHGPAFIFKRSAAQISAAIAGNRGGMNAFSTLTAPQVADIAAYIDAAMPPTTPPLALPPGSPAPAPTPAPAPAPAPAPGTPSNKPSVAMSSPMFSSTEVSKYSQTIGLQVTNSTSAPIVLSNPALIPPAGTTLEFVIAKPPAGTKECKPLDLLDVGTSCSFGVQFAPLNAGPRTEKWTIKFEGSVPAVEVTLEGTAIATAAGSTAATAPTSSSANAPSDGGGGALGWVSLFGLSTFVAIGNARRRRSS